MTDGHARARDPVHTHTHTQMVAIHKLATTLVLLDGFVPVQPWVWI